MATHVRADAHIRFWRRRELKMRVETRDAMNLIEWSVRTLGKRFQFRLGQEAVAKLNSSQVVEDHGAASRIERRRAGRIAGGKCSTDSLAYYWCPAAL